MSIFDIEHCDVPEVHKDLLLKVQSRLPDEDALYDLAELFKVFGDSRASASSSPCSIRNCACATWLRP